MTVQINDLKKGVVPGGGDTFDAFRVSTDPERRYAVVELIPNALFVAVRITSIDDRRLVGNYVNHYSCDNDIPMLMKYTVDWSCIRYGFCKLNLWAPELVNEFGGSAGKTAARFYFDWELYKTCYEEINGVPCERKDPNGEQGT